MQFNFFTGEETVIVSRSNVTLSATREDLQRLSFLCKVFGEGKSAVLRRAINDLYMVNIKNDNIGKCLDDFKRLDS